MRFDGQHRVRDGVLRAVGYVVAAEQSWQNVWIDGLASGKLPVRNRPGFCRKYDARKDHIPAHGNGR